MSEANSPPSIPDDDFNDNAIRRELLRIVRDCEDRVLSDFEEQKSKIRAEAASLGEGSEQTVSIVQDRLEAASLRLPAYFQKMREFIERK